MLRLVVLLLTTAFILPVCMAAPTMKVVEASLTLRADNPHLAKRQQSSDIINGLQALLEKGLVSQERSGNQCHDDCAGWVETIKTCGDYDSYYKMGLCACSNEAIAEMQTCGSCFGGASAIEADDFGGYCREAGVGTAVSAFSTLTGATSAPVNLLSALTRAAASRTSASATSTNAGASSVTQTASASAPSPSSTSASATGGAAVVNQGAGVVVGAAVFVALLAL